MTVFNRVNLELGTIPSRTIKICKNRTSNLSSASQELNADKISLSLSLSLYIYIYTET